MAASIPQLCNVTVQSVAVAGVVLAGAGLGVAALAHSADTNNLPSPPLPPKNPTGRSL